MQREGQARQGCLSVCAQGLCKDAKPTKHTQTLTLQIFLQFIITAYKLQTLNFPLYKRFVGFTKCNKSPSHLPLDVQLRASMPALEKGEASVARSSRANYGGDCNFLAAVFLITLVLSLVNIDKCTHSNSEPEKCYLTNRTIGSLLS